MSEWIRVEDECPAIGQKVILFSNGVVQEDIYMFDGGDVSDYSPPEYFWSREDLDDCPLISPDDRWMPLPSPPTEQE